MDPEIKNTKQFKISNTAKPRNKFFTEMVYVLIFSVGVFNAYVQFRGLTKFGIKVL